MAIDKVQRAEWRRLATDGYQPRGNRAVWAQRCVTLLDALEAAEAAAQRHYAAFVGAEAFGQRVVADAHRLIEELCPHDPDQHAEGTCEVCDYAFALAAAFENEDDGGWHCAHEWLDRPESDTRECLDLRGGAMTPEEKAAKREAVIAGMVARGYTRERAEELIGQITKTLFGPGGRFASEIPSSPGVEGADR